jgi:DNA-binding protein HU-beta
MNKQEIIDHVAAAAGISMAAAGRAVDGFVECVTRSLRGEESVTISGFGTFLLSSRRSRRGRNPQTGEEITIPARRVVRFRSGKTLSETIG